MTDLNAAKNQGGIVLTTQRYAAIVNAGDDLSAAAYATVTSSTLCDVNWKKTCGRCKWCRLRRARKRWDKLMGLTAGQHFG